MKDLIHEIGIAARTGKLVLGFNKVVDLLLTGSPKMVIVSEGSPHEIKEAILYYCQLAGVKCVKAKETTLELGSTCGKPFPVSAIAVIDAGDSDLLN
jgi:large subunit ribosomal protein L30e